MTRVPLPETKRAWLPSAGIARATPHHYDGHREIEQRRLERNETGPVRQFEYLYKCEVTGAIRRWGVAAVMPFTPPVLHS